MKGCLLQLCFHINQIQIHTLFLPYSLQTGKRHYLEYTINSYYLHNILSKYSTQVQYRLLSYHRETFSLTYYYPFYHLIHLTNQNKPQDQHCRWSHTSDRRSLAFPPLRPLSFPFVGLFPAVLFRPSALHLWASWIEAYAVIGLHDRPRASGSR